MDLSRLGPFIGAELMMLQHLNTAKAVGEYCRQEPWKYKQIRDKWHSDKRNKNTTPA